MQTLHRKIMRRVYYAFALRIAGHSVTLHAVVLLLVGYVLTRLVHVAAIVQNMLNVRVGELNSFAISLIKYADVTTLVVTGIALATMLSLMWQLRMPTFRFVQHA